jgi:hypothetical protein
MAKKKDAISITYGEEKTEIDGSLSVAPSIAQARVAAMIARRRGLSAEAEMFDNAAEQLEGFPRLRSRKKKRK